MSKTVFVLGGTGGIGSAVVHSFHRLGWHVAVMARGCKPKNLNLSNDKSVTLYTGNAADENDMRRVGREFAEVHGRADCLVYSVGVPPDIGIALSEYPVEDWDTTFDTYVKGFLLSFQVMLPYMNSGGHIIALGSAITRFSSDSLPPIYAGHYAAAKAALSELVKWSRREAKEKGVRVSLLSPGAVDTAAHKVGDLANVPKKLLPLSVVCDAILSMITNGIEGELQVVA